MPELISPEVECLKLKQAINENHRLAQNSMGDALERTILVGELLGRWKELLPHGKFEPFTETHFDGSLRTAQLYMKVSKGLSSLPKAQRIALLGTEDSLTGLLSRLKKDDSVAAGREARTSEGTLRAPEGGSNPPATASGKDERTETQGSEPQETDPRPPRSGKERNSAPGKVDYGTCPSCGGKKWDVDEFGATCSKCKHPHGEVVDKQPEEEDHAGTLRAKCVKTVEALMRAVDDLDLLVPKAGTHKQTIELCKSILKTARNWK